MTSELNPLHDYPKKGRKFYTFSQDGNGRIKAENTEEHLYLAYLYLSMGLNPKFIKLARRELRSIWKGSTPIQRRNGIFGYIFIGVSDESKGTTLKKSPEAVLMLLQLAAALQRNLDGQIPPNKKSLDIAGTEEITDLVQRLYGIYLSHAANMPLHQLSPGDEQMILHIILKEGLLHAVAAQISSRDSKKPVKVPQQTISADLKPVPDGFFDADKIKKSILKTNYTPCPVSFPGKYLESNFYTWLKWACRGPSKKREKLKLRLRLMTINGVDPEAETQMYLRAVLESVIQSDNKNFKNLKFPKKDQEDFEQVADELIKQICAEETLKNNRKNQAKKSPFEELQFIDFPSAGSFKECKHPVSAVALKRSFLPNFYENLEGLISKDPIPSPFSKDHVKHMKNASTNPGVHVYNKDLNAFAKNLDSNAIYRIKSIKDFEKIAPSTLQAVEFALQEKERALLDLANRLPKNPIDRLQALVKRVSRQEEVIKNADRLILPFINGNPMVWQRINPRLTAKEIEKLNQLIFEYLYLATCQQSWKRVVDLVDKIQNADDECSGQALEKELSLELESFEKFREILTSKEKKPERIRAYAAFAYCANITPRPKQISLIEDFINGVENPEIKEFIAQLIMGGGKSKIILPILALLLADGKRCLVITVPKELIETQKEYMNQLTAGLFDQQANTLIFNRKIPFTAERMKIIRATIDRVIAMGEYLIVTPETIQSLTTKYIELHKIVEDGQIPTGEESAFEDLAYVLHTLRTKGYNIADEADTTLNPRRELNYAIGSFENIPLSSIEVMGDLYTMLSTPPLSGLIKIAENDNVNSFKQNWPLIKRHLAGEFAKRFTHLAERQDALSKYLKGKGKSIPDWIDEKDKEAIGLIRGQLKTFYPLTLSKQGFKDYAFSKNAKEMYAIPARLCQPIEGSVFGTPEESMNYTLQHMLQTGVSAAQIGKLIDDLKKTSPTKN